ncbi:hypothetical protein WBP07_23660 [Novosphingobium sp. BL-8A]|uniref:hypothetical protein n=1 Tax=Novosphingobium sp. BL-8A TaxID=3127639 RepID=UPI00375767A4
MKRSILAASAVAMLAVAGSAQAATTANIAINAQVNSKCGITSTASSITLGDLTDSEAKVRSTVTDEIAQKLNDADVIAFCNTGGSSVNVKRAVLSLKDAKFSNDFAEGGFAQQIRYNLDTSIGGLALDSTSTPGATTVAKRFGGHFSSSDSSTHILFTKAVADGTAVPTVGTYDPTAVNWGSNTDRRMAAGNYSGYVLIELTPGA